MSGSFRVEITGVREGFTQDQVVEKLVALFKSSEAQVRPLLDGRVTPVKKGLDPATAKKYQEALEQAGCACRTVAEFTLEPPAPKAMALVEPAPAPATVDAAPLTATQPMNAAPGGAAPAARPAPIPRVASPKSETLDEDEQMDLLARGQKLVIYSIIGNFVLAAANKTIAPGFSLFLAVVITVMAIVGVLRMCKGFDSALVMKIIAVFLLFVPLANLIVMILLSVKATRRLREAGYTVGLLGASR